MSGDGGRRSDGRSPNPTGRGSSAERNPPDSEVRDSPGPESSAGPGAPAASPAPPPDEHWSEAVRRRVRSLDDAPPPPGADAAPPEEPRPPGEERASAAPSPSEPTPTHLETADREAADPGAAVRERVERRLREASAARPGAGSPGASVPPRPSPSPSPSESPFPTDAPPVSPPDAPEPPDFPAEPLDRRPPAPDAPDRDWEDADWDEVARRARPPAGAGLATVAARLVATCAFVGRLPRAPGTFGALVGLGAALLLRGQPFLLGLAAFLAVTALGTWAAQRYARAAGRDDPPEVVVDECCGMWLAVFGAAPPIALLVGAFALFRALDILKPPPIRQLERLPGGFGIMADDLAAGLVTRILLFAFFGY